MARPRPPYLQKETNRHGKTVWFVRKGDGPRTRIRGDYGTDEFMAAYHAAMAQIAAPQPRKSSVVAAETLAGLIGLYRQSGAWLALSETTRTQRDNIFHHVIENAGTLPYKGITRKDIAKGRDRRVKTPFLANNYLKAMRGVFRWATDCGLIENDPTLGVKPVPTKTDGFHEWSEEEVAQFEARWPIGTRERLALAILLFTGFRRGDAYRLGRRHIKFDPRLGRDVIRLRTEKNGVDVEIPVHPELQQAMDAARISGLALINKLSGEPYGDKFSWGNWFAKACRAAGLPRGCSAHGLRKLCASRWALAGATERQLMAWFGWLDPKMAAHYTRNANRASLARQMFDKAQNETRLCNPAPTTQTPAPEKIRSNNR